MSEASFPPPPEGGGLHAAQFMNTDKLESVIAELELAVKGLETPFLGLPEDGHSLELAYQRGARDAYQNVMVALKELQC